MSDAVSREMKLLVERVVRPLPIPLARQKRLRTELLQHLEAILAEELANNGDAVKAWTRTTQRFGNLSEITAELRRTVTAQDKWTSWWERFWSQRRAESNIRYAGRIAGRFAVSLFAMSTLGMVDHHFFGTIPFALSEFALSSAVIAFLSLWLGGFLLWTLNMGEHWKRRPRRWSKIAPMSVAVLAAWPLSMTIMMWIADGRLSEYELPILGSMACGAGSVIVGIYLGMIHHRDTTYRREWAELKWNS